MRLFLLFVCVGIAVQLQGQSIENLNSRFGFREWRLGADLPKDIEQRAKAKQNEDYCYQWYVVEQVDPLKHIALQSIDLMYEARKLQAVTVNMNEDQFAEALDACRQVFGEPMTLDVAGEELFEWMGTDIRLQLSVAKSDKAAAKCRLSYEWLSPDQTYEACIEAQKPKFSVDDF